ncbi:MAG: acyl-CoA thioesterase [Candidatus Hydrogenedentes bacterium]|nr:acyl-CoA thioesterase [Candidatus Hydrogenedentota bacterium]
MFTHTTRVRLSDTDAAGVMFFARQFDLLHEAFEEFMSSRGVGLPYILGDAPYSLAIVRAECDYTAPLRIGDSISIDVRVENVGAKSFTIGYVVKNGDAVTASAGRTIHVTFDRATRQSVDIPVALREALGEGDSPR